MRAIIAFTPFIPWLLVLASCSSPPEPPSVDESQKRPANSLVAVELQVCKHDLQNTRLLAAEADRAAEFTAANLKQLSARQHAMAALQARPAPPPPQANSVFMVHFEFGSTRVSVPAELTAALIDEARSAPLIVIKGRTDGTTDSPAESRIARERAAAVRHFLVGAGIEAPRIRATYQPAGDHAAANDTATGRALNRRVEIEVYRAAPVLVGSAPAAASSLTSGHP